MSAGEPSDTIPPPMGEDDAYSATTKVGAMPAELMAKLRAEGLLPSESEERRLPPRPKPAAPKEQPITARAVEAAKPASVDSSPPSLISRPPGKDDETLLRPGDQEPPKPARLPSLNDETPSEKNLANATAVAVSLVELEKEDAPDVEVQAALSSVPPDEDAPAAAVSAAPSAAPPSSVSPSSAEAPTSLAAPVSTPTEQPAKKGRVVAVLAILAIAAIAAFMAFGK